MSEIEETLLPGVGVRHEFTTATGERVAVLTHRTGRRELAVYDQTDPDLCRTALRLTNEDAVVLAELLGGSHVGATVREVQRLEGVAIDWIPVGGASLSTAPTIAEGQLRTKTGASIVAIVRHDTTIPAPAPDTAFEAGDVAVAVGTAEGLQRLRAILGE